MLNQETGLRGYLLVNDPRFLQPYRQGVAAVRTENPMLDRLFGTDSSVSSLLLEMRRLEQAWISQWAQLAAAGHAPRGRAALIAFLFEGKSLFDAYRAKEEALSARVDSRRDGLYNSESVAFAIG